MTPAVQPASRQRDQLPLAQAGRRRDEIQRTFDAGELVVDDHGA
jgi:hypothetical protein